MSAVVGVDSSTQACKVLVVDAETGTTLASGSAPHPDGTAIDPRLWVRALREAWGRAGVHERDDLIAVSVAGQQHAMVAVDGAGVPVHDALLWNDVRSADAAARMVRDMGVAGWVDAVQLLPVPAITLTKLAWLREHCPEAAARVHRVMLPHDWLLLHLTGAFATDRSDASGTGYFSAVTNQYRTDLLDRYFGFAPELPRLVGPAECAGFLLPEWSDMSVPVPVAAGAGDNAAAALALELEAGDVAISVGTSGTVFARSARPVADPSGLTAGFADATGEFLPLLCTINAARVMTSTAALLGVDLDRFDSLALAGSLDAGGLTMIPYFDGERTPNLPAATGELRGLTRASLTPENLARGAVLAIANSLADCLDVLAGIGTAVERVTLIGGGANSHALRAALADTLGQPIVVPEVREFVAIGAARQAAWMATGQLPPWVRQAGDLVQPLGREPAEEYRARYVELRSELVANAPVQSGQKP